MSLSNGLLKEGSLKFLDFRSDVTYQNQSIPSVWLANFLTDNNIPWIAKSTAFLCIRSFGVTHFLCIPLAFLHKNYLLPKAAGQDVIFKDNK